MDGHDGNGLQLDRNWANFFQVLPLWLRKIAKKGLAMLSLFKFNLLMSVPEAFRGLEKVFSFKFSADWPKNVKSSWSSVFNPVSFRVPLEAGRLLNGINGFHCSVVIPELAASISISCSFCLQSLPFHRFFSASLDKNITAPLAAKRFERFRLSRS